MNDNISIRSREEYLNDVVLDYAPFFSTLPSVVEEAKIEDLKFTTLKADQDIEAKIINAQDTEVSSIKAGSDSKKYAKIFKGAKYIESNLQKQSALPDLHNRVIKSYTMQLDKEIFQGTDNNGIIFSQDKNFIEADLGSLPKTPSGVEGAEALIDLVSDQKDFISKTCGSSSYFIGVYGNTLQKYFRKLLVNGTTYLQVVRAAHPDVQFVSVPSAVVKEGQQGLVSICNNIVLLHYTMMPTIDDVGENKEDKYVYARYLYGSALVDIKDYGGIINRKVDWVD